MPHSSFFSTIYPHWTAVQLQRLTVVQQRLILDVVSIWRRARCPACQRLSRRVHSHFTRLVTDLPLAGFPVSRCLHGRRFRCLNRACPRQTFRERVLEIVLPYQRRTPALKHRLEGVGFALGGQAGARLVAHLQLAMSGASRNSLLRLVRQAVLPDSDGTRLPLRILGIDDCAFRRGVRSGAIVVNLEQHRVVDVLANRDAATMAAWLEQHGGSSVEIVSRDRGGAFAEAVRQAAPQATQVADRFHILQNLGQALDRILTREHAALTRAADTVSRALTKPRQLPPQDSTPVEQPPRTRLERDHAAVEARRQDRYERVMALAQEEYSLRAISRRAGVSRGSVRSYVRAGQYRPCARPSRQPQGCDAYLRTPPTCAHAGLRGNTTVPCSGKSSGRKATAAQCRPCVSMSAHGGQDRATWGAAARARMLTNRHHLLRAASLPAKRGGFSCVPWKTSPSWNERTARRCVKPVRRLLVRRRSQTTLVGSYAVMPPPI